MESDATYLGKVIRVDSSAVEIEIGNEIPSASPIIGSKVYKIGQIGTFIKIISGNITTYGLVASVSNSPSTISTALIEQRDIHHESDIGKLYLTVNLIGEKIGNHVFEKGIGLYPTINDEAHLVTDNDLYDIYGHGVRDRSMISIGKHASSDNLDVFLDIHKLILRHSAILGSTGSGKSNTVVSIIKSIISDMSNSRVLLVDPHGEYASAFPDARIFRINSDTEEDELFVPFWLMNFDELMYFLVGAKQTDENRPEYRKFREYIVEAKRNNVDLHSGEVREEFITADSPIPFNIRRLWYRINRNLNATYNEKQSDKQTEETECLECEGDAEILKPAKFTKYSMGNSAPYKASNNQEFYAYEKKLLSRLKDSRYDFMFNPGEYKDRTTSKDLHDLLQDWIGSEERLAILDLSNVPFEILDITVGLITRFLYDSMFWGRYESYTGRQRPLVIAYEEAHSYLGKNGSNYACNAVERIFKEGRKFGLGSMVISQRPSELSETILAQVGTFIALRLTNSSDQSIVKSMAPDNMNSLINVLPALRIGEAVVIGEAINIPSRVRIPLQHPRPDSSDPDLVAAWSQNFEKGVNDYKSVVTKMREQKF